MSDTDKLAKDGLKLMKENGLPSVREDRAREDIALAIVETAHDDESWERVIKSKDMKKGLRKWNNEAFKLLAAQRELRELVEDDWVANLHLREFGFEEIEQHIRHTLEKTDPLAIKPSGQVVRSEPRKERAAHEALRLIRRYDLPDATTKGGLFCRLAAILSGEPKADLHHHCRAAKRASADSGSK